MSEPIINKVAESSLLTIDLEAFYPKEPVVVFDLKPFLYMGLILKEKEFRLDLQQHDWAAYQGKIVAVTCSADAIIPVWAYMLVTSSLQPVAAHIVLGDEKEALRQTFLRNLESVNAAEYTDKRVVIKGCGDTPIEPYAYLEITRQLLPYVKSIMYGEPCSTVPVYKKK